MTDLKRTRTNSREPTPTKVAQRIALCRQDAGISMLSLAMQSTISLTALQRHLGSGTSKLDDLLTLHEIERLSRVLSIPISSWLAPLAA